MRTRLDPATLLDFLPAEGPTSALTTKYLAKLLDVHPRAVTRCVQLLRLDGVPIVSNVSGYWIADSPEDIPALRRCCRSLAHRIREQRDTLEALEKALSALE